MTWHLQDKEKMLCGQRLEQVRHEIQRKTTSLCVQETKLSIFLEYSLIGLPRRGVQSNLLLVLKQALATTKNVKF